MGVRLLVADEERQDARVNSRVDNRGAKYTNVRDVYNAPVIKQKIVKDNSSIYQVDREDVHGMEKFSMWVMRKIGETRAKVTAIVTVLLGGGGVFSITSPSVQVPASLLTPLAFTSFGFILVGAAMVAALQYKADSRCVKCNKFYAMQEHGVPTVKEVPRRGGAQKSTTRHYKCRFCGEESSKTKNEFIEDEPKDS